MTLVINQALPSPQALSNRFSHPSRKAGCWPLAHHGPKAVSIPDRMGDDRQERECGFVIRADVLQICSTRVAENNRRETGPAWTKGCEWSDWRGHGLIGDRHPSSLADKPALS